MALHDRVVVQVDRRGKVRDDVLCLVFRNAQDCLELARLNDASEEAAGVDVLAKLERRIAEALKLAGFGRRHAHRGDAALLFGENPAQALDLTLLKLDLLLLGRLNVVELFLDDVQPLLHLGGLIVRRGDVVCRRELLCRRASPAPPRDESRCCTATACSRRGSAG